MRVTAGTTFGSVVVAIVAVMSAMVLLLPSAVTSAYRLLAAPGTVLVVPGTGTNAPLPTPTSPVNYLDNAVGYYVAPSVTACNDSGNPCASVGVPYLAQFWPIPLEGWGGLSGAKWDVSVQSGVNQLTSDLIGPYNPSSVVDGPKTIVFGYSQGATVASIVKGTLSELPDTQKDNMAFVLIGNPNRPNGGLFERLAILGTVPILDATFGQPTPTDTDIDTTDVAFQYDGVADFASAPINVLADLNALAGFWYIHGTYLDPRGRPPETTPDGALPYGYTADEIQGIIEGCKADSSGANCQEFGDTIYVTLPATSLPIMQPFIDLGATLGASALVNPIVALLQPATQTLIETGYDRTDYGTPTPFQIIPQVNPITLVTDLVNDVPEGIEAAIDTIQSPSHTIPDLPPTWGSDAESLTIAAQGSEEIQQAIAVPEFKLPKIALPNLDAPKVGPVKLNDKELRDEAIETRRGFHPVRDLVTSLKKSQSKPIGLEKALSRLKDHSPKKVGPSAPTGG